MKLSQLLEQLELKNNAFQSDSARFQGDYEVYQCTLSASSKRYLRLEDHCLILQDFELYEKASKLLLKEQVLTHKKAILMELLYQNHTLQDLIDTAYQILDNPIFLVDTSYKILASCQNIVYDRPDLAEQTIAGYMKEENIESMKKDRLYEIAREQGYPYYSKQEGSSYGWVTALIHVHGIESAQMGVMDSNHPIEEQDLELIDFLCRLISIELQKSNFYKNNQSLMHSFFLSELLENRIRDIHTIRHRIQNLTWKVTEYMYILTISEQRADIFDKKAQLISKQLHLILPDSRWVIYDGRIVFLLCLPDASGAIFREGSELSNYLQINNLTASVSRCFHSFLEVHKYYEESLTAYTMGQRFDPDKHMYLYSDYVCQHIGEIISEQYKLTDFYHPVIASIQEYDMLHNSHLLETLKEYLTYPDNPSLAAEHLFVHKNTLFYRMSKLKELFNVDLSNGEERLKIHLSLKFMELKAGD
ncbi:MAG: hypothetical protein PWP24_1160 [Clostridiales bacterium]|nr:hypothetical protein [Clostridiales bacterium]